MKKRRFISGTLTQFFAMSLICGLVGCSQNTVEQETINESSAETVEQSSKEESPETSVSNEEMLSFIPGTYTGTGEGMYGEITVEVTVSESEITDIKVTSYHDTEIIAQAAIGEMPEKIINYQSVAVDAATGATFCSRGIISAVTDALEQADGNMELLKAPLPEVEKEKLPDEEYDIVIVGAGGAGMTAAMQAGRISDYSVLVLEKAAWCGGSTALSGGQIAVAGTEKNEQEGVYDFTADEFLDFYKKRAAEMDRRPEDMWINETLVHRIGEQAPEIYNYFIEEGIDQPDYENNAKFGEEGRGITGFKNKAKGAGPVWGTFLQSLAEKNGAEIRTNSRVVDLVVEDGAVTGVVVETPESTYTVHAEKVILATGGFAQNINLFREQNSYYENIDKVWPYTAGTLTGDAFEFTADLNPAYTGYGFICMQSAMMPYGFESELGSYPTFGIYLWVNQDGERFVDELEYYYHKTFSVIEQEGGFAYALVSGKEPASYYGSMPIEELAEKLEARGGAWSADTLEELCEKTGMNIEKVKISIEEDTKRAVKGAKDTYGDPLYPAVTDEGPYYAFKITPSVIATMYGLKLDDHFQVVNTEGKPIENLYAAGELTMGNYFFQEYVATSNAVACAIYGGSLAAEEAVEDLNSR